MTQVPTAAFVLMLFVQSIAAFTGGLVSGVIAGEYWKLTCLLTALLLLLGNIANMLMIPHPIWFNIISLLIYFPMAYWGGRLLTTKHRT